MLLALGAAPNYHMYLGVQRDELVVDRYDNSCTLPSNSGIATLRQSFFVDRQNEHLFVLRLRKGAFFTGDFRHAGVQDMTQKELTAKLVRLVAPPSRTRSINAAGEDSLLQTFMSFHGLNDICRLHVVTRPLDTVTTLDQDKVSFDMCVPNKGRGHSESRPDDPKSLHVDVSVREIDRQTRKAFAFDKHFHTIHVFKGAVEAFAIKYFFTVTYGGHCVKCALDAVASHKNPPDPSTTSRRCKWFLGYSEITSNDGRKVIHVTRMESTHSCQPGWYGLMHSPPKTRTRM
jgi:hypothetical protein